MPFNERARNYWACVSILFNQTVHLGGAPYPYTFSETCWLRRGRLQYDVARATIDAFFELFGEYNHCEMSYMIGRSYRARPQR